MWLRFAYSQLYCLGHQQLQRYFMFYQIIHLTSVVYHINVQHSVNTYWMMMAHCLSHQMLSILPGEHYLNTTETVEFTYFQKVSLAGKFNEQLQLLPVILVGTKFSIFLISITSQLWMKCSRTLCFLIFITMVICGSQNVASFCTLENVTLIGYGLLGGNSIGRFYLSITVINLTKSSKQRN